MTSVSKATLYREMRKSKSKKLYCFRHLLNLVGVLFSGVIFYSILKERFISQCGNISNANITVKFESIKATIIGIIR